MSKQLAISAACSVFVMAAFALFATDEGARTQQETATGAKTVISAPAFDRHLPALPFTGS